ncbi:uncharacterized protein LOC129775349 [Toxorhynchites rutilus septentrionalis]|uniref:uncharacterized protein LOC129775349 n=1 Tax=Toxorhynchites rutilus septentrionalis TaxID=329112 RepID=UPI00247933F9|nr:uncharacterized protein LOC129775349 [Toxorhynchites rutilus septentrionalis]
MCPICGIISFANHDFTSGRSTTTKQQQQQQQNKTVSKDDGESPFVWKNWSGASLLDQYMLPPLGYGAPYQVVTFLILVEARRTSLDAQPDNSTVAEVSAIKQSAKGIDKDLMFRCQFRLGFPVKIEISLFCVVVILDNVFA